MKQFTPISVCLLIFIVCLAFSSPALYISSEANANQKTVILNPIADTFVDGKYHWANRGSSPTLAVWAYGDKYTSFLKFYLLFG